jgi:hypothetical protein
MTTTAETIQQDGVTFTKAGQQIEMFPPCQMTGKHTFAACTTREVDTDAGSRYVLVRECLHPGCNYEVVIP